MWLHLNILVNMKLSCVGVQRYLLSIFAKILDSLRYDVDIYAVCLDLAASCTFDEKIAVKRGR
jgi:hypothetical protein